MDANHNARVLALADIDEIKLAMRKAGVDERGIEVMAPKAVHRLVKLEALDPRAANILKQEMLALDGEVAISKKVYYLTKKETTDAILLGTTRQYEELCAKMVEQPFGLAKVAEEIKKVLENYSSPSPVLRAGGHELDLGRRTHAMGALNVTPDSFSDGGRFFRLDRAVAHALKMVEEGADLIDVGGESTRPGAEPVSLDEELNRVIPVIEALSSKIDKPISIDSYKPEVVQRALDAGASIVNDINGLRNEKMVELVARRSVLVCIMHMQGTPRDMQLNPRYECLMGEIISFLRQRAQVALGAGVRRENIILDPGIGFGKTREHNLEIMRRLSEIKSLGFPILIGTSRKSFIGLTLDLPVEERLEGTAATVAYAIAQGANIVRVHDVKEMVRVARMTDAMVRGR